MMSTSMTSSQTRRFHQSWLAALLALLLLAAIPTSAFADTVRVSDPVGVLSQSQLTSEGAHLTYPLDIYTTNFFNGTAVDFISRTISSHLTSKRLIVIAIDTVHHYLAIVAGSSVPLSKSQNASAGTAFKNNFSSGFTAATMAAIRSLESSLGVASTGSSNPLSGLILFFIIGGLILLAILGAAFRFIRRLFGYNPPPRPPTTPTQEYGDGRDNFGSGSVGTF